MKFQRTSAFVALLTLCYWHSSAQVSTPPVNEPNYNKPKIFTDLPDNLTINLSRLEALLQLPVGSPVNTIIATGFGLQGTVISKSNPSDASVRSVVIKSGSRQQATLTFTRITKQDGSITYIGRMLSKDAGDALEIVNEGDHYVIRKRGLYDMINE
jgi:hypothetical protein